MAETASKSNNTFDPFNMTKGRKTNQKFGNSSPGKTVFMASERGSDDRGKSNRKFGGHVMELRTLKGV